MVAARKVYNALPDDVTSAESLPTLKEQLKRYLFKL